MNCIVLIAVLGAVVLNVTCLPPSDAESYPWGDVGVDAGESSGFESYGGLDDSVRGLAPEPQPNYDVPIHIRDSYNRYTGSVPLAPYVGEAKYWSSPEDRAYDEREMYRRTLNYLLQIVRGAQPDRREFGGRPVYEFSPYDVQKNYHSGSNRYGNAYNLGPLLPERRFQNPDIFTNEPYARVDIQPSPVYAGV